MKKTIKHNRIAIIPITILNLLFINSKLTIFTPFKLYTLKPPPVFLKIKNCQIRDY